MYQVLRITDGTRNYQYLYDGQRIYIPDFNPLKFGYKVDYAITTYNFRSGESTEQIISPLDSMPCVPFRYENHTYSEYIPVNIPSNVYVGFEVFEDGNPSTTFTSAQASSDILNALAVTDGLCPAIYAHLTWSIDGPNSLKINCLAEQFLAEQFRALGAHTSWTSVLTRRVETTFECVIMDDEDIYAQTSSHSGATYGSAEDIINVDLEALFGSYGSRAYKDDLRFVALVKYRIFDIKNPSVNAEWIIKTNSLPITPEIWSQIPYIWDETRNIDRMQILTPRIVNQTSVQVVEMTSQSDSKSNIVQPVFFRARELASIVVHPEVTENISINLDAYKSQTDKFMIKIEGTVFQEIGRVEGGVIFKIQGSMLPGKLSTGIYYILNSDAELITTGKYSYEV